MVDNFRRHIARWFCTLGTVTFYSLANITPDSAEVLKRKQGTFQGCIADPRVAEESYGGSAVFITESSFRS